MKDDDTAITKNDCIVLGLMFRCPLPGDPNPEKCPLYYIRKDRTIAELYTKFKHLSEEEKLNILDSHSICNLCMYKTKRE